MSSFAKRKVVLNLSLIFQFLRSGTLCWEKTVQVRGQRPWTCGFSRHCFCSSKMHVQFTFLITNGVYISHSRIELVYMKSMWTVGPLFDATLKKFGDDPATSEMVKKFDLRYGFQGRVRKPHDWCVAWSKGLPRHNLGAETYVLTGWPMSLRKFK